MATTDSEIFTVNHPLRKAVSVLLAIFVFLLGTHTTFAKWEIECSDWLINAMNRQGHFVPKRDGSYATKPECEEARKRAIIKSGDPSMDLHLRCVGFDEPSNQTKPSFPSLGPGVKGEGGLVHQTPPEQSERERQEREKDQQAAHEREKKELFGKLKGTSNQATPPKKPAAETGSLPLKPYTPPHISPPVFSSVGNRERTVKTIKELNCSAHYGLAAAVFAGVPVEGPVAEFARKYAEYSAMAKEGKTVPGCPEVKISVPEVPPPMEANPQIRLYNHIIMQTDILVSEIVATTQNLESTKSRLAIMKKDIAGKQEEINQSDRHPNKPGGKSDLEEKKKEAEKEKNELEEAARALEEQAKQLKIIVQEKNNQLYNLRKMHETLTNHPERAEEFIRSAR